MLAQERFEKILELLRKEQSVTVTDLTKQLNTSESTIRRDLTLLDKQGLLIKVHGGATAVKSVFALEEAVTLKSKKIWMKKERLQNMQQIWWIPMILFILMLEQRQNL